MEKQSQNTLNGILLLPCTCIRLEKDEMPEMREILKHHCFTWVEKEVEEGGFIHIHLGREVIHSHPLRVYSRSKDWYERNFGKDRIYSFQEWVSEQKKSAHFNKKAAA